MERSNQPPEPECCLSKGGEGVDLHHYQTERSRRSVHREKREPQAGPASCLSKTASKRLNAAGDDVEISEPNTEETTQGEVTEELPGSKSVARAEEDTRNWGGPGDSRRTNYEGQAGRKLQRQEGATEGNRGFGSAIVAHSNPVGAEVSEGTDTITQPEAKASTVRETEERWHTFLRGIAEKARKQPENRFKALYTQLNQENLRLCFYLLRKDAASGVDGVSFKDYEKDLEANLADLIGRLKRKGYRCKLVRRKYIPKGPGKFRPLGIPALEDKMVQMAVTQILMAIYEMDFLDCSYGYRPERSAHQAVRNLTDELHFGNYQFLVEADIKGFFENLDHEKLVEMLEERIHDGALIRLIRKWLRAGILEEDGKVVHPASGTPQGGIISPVLANVYLHHALDQWFEEEVRKKTQGRSMMIRYADDFVACFEREHEAVAYEQALSKRLTEYGLEVAKDKTKTFRFGRQGGPWNGRFDFLGFEFYWEKDRKGRPAIKRRTARKKMRIGMQRLKEWIQARRNQKVRKVMKTLASKLRGTWNYYGILGNSRSMSQFYDEANRTVFKWLNRRSQKRSYTWKGYNRLLQRFEVPPPRIVEKPYQPMPCQLEWGFAQRVLPFLKRVSAKVAYARAS